MNGKKDKKKIGNNGKNATNTIIPSLQVRHRLHSKSAAPEAELKGAFKVVLRHKPIKKQEAYILDGNKKYVCGAGISRTEHYKDIIYAIQKELQENIGMTTKAKVVEKLDQYIENWATPPNLKLFELKVSDAVGKV